MNRIKIKSYAKVNLTLEIVGVEGAYHLLDSLVASIDLFDLIDIKKRKDTQNFVMMHGMNSETIPLEQNNAKKAADAFCREFGVNGVDITVYKNIPIGGGLGGSSADIVGVLNGMAKLYDINDFDRLKRLADSLGSDTGYMLTGGFARMQGRGERVQKLETDAKLYALLLCPSSSVSVGACYRGYDELKRAYTNGETTEKCIQALMQQDVNAVGRYLTNALFEPASRLCEGVKSAYLEAQGFSPLGVMMSGSGSCVFAIFETRELCEWAKSRYKGEHQAYVVETIIPKW